MQDLGEDDGAERRDLARLEHDGAAGRERRRKFRRDLVERPVPWRDQAANADRLAPDQRAAHVALELVALEHLDHLLEMAERVHRLDLAREGDGRAHLHGHRLRQFLEARLIAVDDPLQQREAVLALRLRIAREGAARGSHSSVHVRGTAQADLAGDLLGGRIDDLEAARLRWLNPLAVNIEFVVVGHCSLPSSNPSLCMRIRYILLNITKDQSGALPRATWQHCSAFEARGAAWRDNFCRDNFVPVRRLNRAQIPLCWRAICSGRYSENWKMQRNRRPQ